MTGVWQSAAVAILGVAALASAAVAIVTTRRSRSDWKEMARRVDELSLRLRAMGAGAAGQDNPPPSRGGSVKKSGGRPLKPSPLVGDNRAGGKSSLRLDPASAIPRPTLIAVPSMATPDSEPIAREAAEILSHRHGPIWDLADAGETPSAIAQATGQPIGRIELILALRRQAEVSHG